jgi:hypothetical protein
MPEFSMADMAAALASTIGPVPPNGHAAKSPRLTVRRPSSAPALTTQEETTPMPPTKTSTTIAETPEQELARLRAENDLLKASVQKAATISMRVGEKGGLSVYGLGRFPTTLYKEQWLRLLNFIGAPLDNPIRAFINAHPELKTKEG